MSNTMRFAIVGAGVLAPLHAEAISHNPQAELIAIADIRLEKAKHLAQKFPDVATYTDYEKMLKREDIDVVCVCVPSGLHEQVVVAAAQAGKHVFCEKPLEITLEKADRILEACHTNNVKLGVAFQRRTLPAAMAARKVIEEGKLGRLIMGNAYLKYYRSPEYYRSADWRGTWEWDGGGALMNQGIHGTDLIQWLTGGVVSVYAYTDTLVREIEVEDTAVALLKYKNGAFGVIQATTSVYPEQETRLELNGSRGSIAFADSGVKMWKFFDEVPLPDLTMKQPEYLSVNSHALLIDDMIWAIREDRDPIVTGEEARKSLQIILSIYESSMTGEAVML